MAVKGVKSMAGKSGFDNEKIWQNSPGKFYRE
jgi:hypothetical protein